MQQKLKKNQLRQIKVLRHLVEEYIATSQTVCSRVICEKYVPEVSPATVRIDLHKLEERNLIYQPHTSAGRVPTIAGFRAYLDGLREELHTVHYPRSGYVRDFLIENYRDTPLALHYIKQLLAKETDQLSFVAEPEMSNGILSKLDVFRIGPRKLLFVVSLDSGLDKTVILNTESDLTEQQLRVLVRYANDELAGQRIHDIMYSYLHRLAQQSGDQNKLLADFLRQLHHALREISSYFIHFDSSIEFFEQPEFDERRNILLFLDFIQRHEFLVNLMQKHEHGAPYTVFLGEDLGRPEWAGLVLVYARYEIFEVPGYLGILAPVRMNYAKNIPIVRDIAETITKTTRKGMMVPRYEKARQR
ncbi:MAG: heat-inducible transcriptional repressor HrcA [Candidatus Cloacimonetes bacterium]|nr:heat-inducible transcriptional repressor HrcA [Candidatus Cloacimonadota bacterium]